MNHTKGPWEIEHDSEDWGQWLEIGPARIYYRWNDKEEESQAKADANLIAAAPEMYEALMAIKNGLEQTTGTVPSFLIEALNKAKGVTND